LLHELTFEYEQNTKPYGEVRHSFTNS